MIVQLVVVYHLSNGQVLESTRILRQLKISPECLHQQGLAYTDISAQEQVVAALVALVGKHIFCLGASVEIIHHEPQNISIVVIHYELSELSLQALVSA